MIQFGSMVEKKRILNSGPWFFNKTILLLECPNRVCQPKDLNFKYVTFWVHLCNLPLIYMNKQFIAEIGKRVGEVVEVDQNASGEYWGKFARVRIKIDITVP